MTKTVFSNKEIETNYGRKISFNRDTFIRYDESDMTKFTLGHLDRNNGVETTVNFDMKIYGMTITLDQLIKKIL